MKHLGIIKKLAGAVAAALVLGSAVLGCSMFDSSDSSDSSDTNGGKARLLFSESGMRSLITPTAVQESDITKAELKAAPVNGEAETLKIWTSASEKNAVTLMTEEQNLFVDAGTYDFTLNLYVKLGNEEILCQSGVLTGKNVVSGDNRLDFETHYVLDGKGKLSVSLTLDSAAGVDKIAYEIFALNDDLTLADTAAASGLVDGASFNASLATGYYSILLKLYNGTSLLNTLDYTAKIMAGCTSQGMLNITDVNTLHSLTFMLGNDVDWVNNPGEILRNSSTKIKLPAASDIKREGYRLTNWLISNTPYAPEATIQLSADTVVKPLWQKTWNVTFVNGDDTSEFVVDNGTTVTAPAAPTKDGCLFLGWYNGDTKYVFSSPVTSKLTLTAKWQRGDGTEQMPYLIGTFEEWNDFTTAVLNGTTYEGKYLKLDADIGTEANPVTTMVGYYSTNGESYSNPFKGAFDGNNKTLTVQLDLSGSEYFIAPFKYVNGGTIKNLTVKGSVTTTSCYASGLVAVTTGAANITNCVSEVAITSSLYDSGYHGGFVASNRGGTVTISDSEFRGSLLTTNSTYYSAGFVGELSISNNAHAVISNCLFAPSRVTMGTSYSATFVAGLNPEPYITLTSCYYTMPFGTLQGNQVYENAADIPSGFYDPVTVRGKSYCAINNVAVSGLSEVFLHTGSPIDISYSVKDGGTTLTADSDYTARILKENIVVTTVTDAGTYILEITASENSSYCGTLRKTFYVLADLSGSGTQNDPYIIASDLDWINFAKRVTNGTTYESKFIKMTADIGSEAEPVTVMAGKYEDFMGTFDGNGKTLTICYKTANEKCAPFLRTYNATIKDLTVSGSIESTNKYVGGIVESCGSGTVIENCVVNVSISCNKNVIGGFAAECFKSTFKDCVFAGKLLRIDDSDSQVEFIGGIVGYVQNSSPTFENFVFAPSEVTINYNTTSNGRDTKTNTIRGYGGGTINNCYYTRKLGDTVYPEGTFVYESLPEGYNDLYKLVTVCGKTFYQPYETTIKGLLESYSLSSDSVSPSYIVEIGTTVLAENSDYIATITNSSGNEVSTITTAGTYTLTITGMGTYNTNSDYSGTKTVSFTVE